MNLERLSNADLEIEIILAAKKLARLNAIKQRRERMAKMPARTFRTPEIEEAEA